MTSGVVQAEADMFDSLVDANQKTLNSGEVEDQLNQALHPNRYRARKVLRITFPVLLIGIVIVTLSFL